MKNIYKLALASALLFVSKSHAQVDPHFSQYYANQLWLNPALTGSTGADYRVSANYRSQWAGIGNGFKTAAVSADFATDKDLNFGVTLLNQAAGTGGYNYTNGQFTMSYTGIRFGAEGNHHISFGMNVGLLNRRFDVTKLQEGAQWQAGIGFNPSIGSSEVYTKTSSTSADLGAGIAYFDANEDKRFNVFGGISATHLNQPKDPFMSADKSILSVRSCFYGGVIIKLSDDIRFVPNLLYMRQNTAREKMIGGYGQFKINETTNFMLGGNARINDAFVPYAGLTLGDLTLGFSYDATMSGLSQMTKGSNAFEISLSFFKKNSDRPQYLECPRM